jgi:RNase H-like domain found in reverse transcriptase/Integrase zinc binding domain/Integrase core domain
MPPPRTGSDLQQFCCSLNWMRTSIPDYARLVAPLHAALEHVYSVSRKRTRAAAANVLLVETGWGETELAVFGACKNALEHATILSYPTMTKRLCLYTDASDRFWSAIVTQVPHADLDLPVAPQAHEPLAFLSGAFTGSAERWSVVEKEGFAILTACERLGWLLQTSAGFSLFTDHRNLCFIFDPFASNPGISNYTGSKLLRWALRLSQYRYEIEHVRGKDNIWADILTRWAAPAQPRARISGVFCVPVPSSSADSFTWPSSEEIRSAQIAALSSRPVSDPPAADGYTFQFTNGLYCVRPGVVWVPATAVDLQLRLAIVAHTGMGGHRGVQATTDAIAKVFAWKTLATDIRDFCNTCLVCCATLGGNRVPRPLGEAIHATLPNEVIHFDYLYMGHASNGHCYLLLIKDDFSGFVKLIPSKAADSTTVVHSLAEWFSSFGVASIWVSDQGSHFKNHLVQGLSDILRTRHHFTTAYTPWSNGTVERLCREVLRAVRALLAELRLSFTEWPKVVMLFQAVVNHTPSKHRGGVAPVTAFTGLPPTTPLLAVMNSQSTSSQTLEFVRAKQLINVDQTQASLEAVHKTVRDSTSSNRASARRTKNSPSHVTAPNFSTGDYVLVAKREFASGEKLTVRWRGPRRILQPLSDLVFLVEDLRDGTCEEVHATRLKFYHDASLDVTDELLSQLVHNEQGYVVHSLQDLTYDQEAKHFLVRVRWSGFTAADDTWENLLSLFEDIPDLVMLFLAKHTDAALANQARDCLPSQPFKRGV